MCSLKFCDGLRLIFTFEVVWKLHHLNLKILDLLFQELVFILEITLLVYVVVELLYSALLAPHDVTELPEVVSSSHELDFIQVAASYLQMGSPTCVGGSQTLNLCWDNIIDLADFSGGAMLTHELVTVFEEGACCSWPIGDDLGRGLPFTAHLAACSVPTTLYLSIKRIGWALLLIVQVGYTSLQEGLVAEAYNFAHRGDCLL